MLGDARAAGRCAVMLVTFASATGVNARTEATAPASQPGITVTLSSASESERTRVTKAADETVARLSEWLGPLPGSLNIIDRQWRAGTTSSPGTASVALPWLSAPATMEVESQVAYAVARQWFRTLETGAETRPIAQGIAWYLQSRIVERLFDFTFFVPGHSAAGTRFFGGSLPWAFPLLPLSRWTVGLSREGMFGDPLTPRFALAFATLERYVGWPALQGSLRVLAERARSGPITAQDVERTLSEATGQDLSWFLTPVFDATQTFDYAVDAFSTEPLTAPCEKPPCYRTRATVLRRGSAAFTGTPRPPVGTFDAGDAMELRVLFADGQRVSSRWSGREASHTFEFESLAPAVDVRLDPERVLLLDRNSLDNGVRLTRGGEPSIGKWLANWLVWLQDATLSYGFLL